MRIPVTMIAAISGANIVTPFGGQRREFAEHCSAATQPAGCAKPAVGQGAGGIAHQIVMSLRFLMGEIP